MEGTKPTKPFALSRGTTVALTVAAIGAGLLLPWLLPAGGGAAAPDPPAFDHGGALVRLYTGALVVLGLGVGGLWLYRRRLAALAPAGRPAGQLESLGSARLAPHGHVLLVRARGQKLLVGIDATGLKLLVPVPSEG